MAKQPAKAKEPTKEKTVTAKKKLILKNSIHISGVKRGKDGKDHMVHYGHYPAGTPVTQEMIDAYEINRKAIQGDTPIDRFCE